MSNFTIEAVKKTSKIRIILVSLIILPIFAITCYLVIFGISLIFFSSIVCNFTKKISEDRNFKCEKSYIIKNLNDLIKPKIMIKNLSIKNFEFQNIIFTKKDLSSIKHHEIEIILKKINAPWFEISNDPIEIKMLMNNSNIENFSLKSKNIVRISNNNSILNEINLPIEIDFTIRKNNNIYDIENFSLKYKNSKIEASGNIEYKDNQFENINLNIELINYKILEFIIIQLISQKSNSDPKFIASIMDIIIQKLKFGIEAGNDDDLNIHFIKNSEKILLNNISGEWIIGYALSTIQNSQK